MYGYESWTIKKADHWRINFWAMVLEKTLESPLDCKEIQPVNPKGDQSWIFMAESEAPIVWPPDAKNWLIGKDPDAGKDCRQEEKGTTEDEMVGWDHWLNGHEFEQALGVGDGQGSLACCRKGSQSNRHDWVTELNRVTKATRNKSWNAHYVPWKMEPKLPILWRKSLYLKQKLGHLDQKKSLEQ